MKSILLPLTLILLLTLLGACGDSDESPGGSANTSNGTTATSNSTTATSNGTTATSNGTTATSNGTTATSNGTTATSNGTTATSNGTTATSNGTTATSNGTTATSNGTTATSNGTMPDCTEEIGCEAGEICAEGMCIEGCNDDEGCEEGEICDTEDTMLCIPGCREDVQCGPGQICEDAMCRTGCRETIACGSGRYCNDELRCVAGCESDATCGEDRVCLANICTDGCRDDSACPVNRICDANACRNGCRENEQCSQGQICIDTTCQAGCRDNNGCPGEQLCQSGVCRDPVVNCEDDDREPNGMPNNATPMEGDSTTFQDNVLCPGDRDLYRLQLSAGMNVLAEIDFTRAEGSLNLSILNANGEFLRAANTWANSELLRFTADSAGTYFLAVSGNDENQSNTYNITALTNGGTLPCQDDGLENNDRFEQSTIVMGNTTLNSASCPSDDDWFRLPTLANTRVTATITFEHSESDLQLFMYGPDGTTQIASSETTNNTEQITYTATETGNIYIRVLTTNTEFGAPYQLRIALSSLCDDIYDPNDTFNDPSLLTEGSYSDLVLCDGGNDFFQITLEEGETLTADLMSDSSANLDLFVLSPGGQAVLDSSSTPGSTENASAVATERGLYIVRVQSISGPPEPAFYTLDLDVEPAIIDSNCNDVFEPNNSAATADDSITILGASICEDDIDYYAFNVARAGTQIRLFVQATNPSAPVTYAIIGADGFTVLAEYTGNDNPVTINADADTPGTYYARLTHQGGNITTTYTLSRTLLAPPACEDDAYEPNNTFIQAAELVGEIPNSILCDTDTDIFKINVAEPFTRLRVLAQPTRPPNGTVELISPMFEVLETQDLYLGVSAFNFLTPDPGLFYVRVRQSDGINQLFYIEEEQTVLPFCIDQFEDNDNTDEAPLIGEGQWSDLSLCWEFDEADLYALDLNTGETLTVTVSLDNDAGNLDLLLLGSDGVSVRGMSLTDNDVEEIVFPVTGNGRYYVRVQTLNMDSNYYSMEINIE